MRYWNGYQFVDHHEPTSQEREALLEAELNPRTKTGEHEPLVEFDVTDVTPEQPPPNMLETVPLTTVRIEGRDKPVTIAAFVPTEAALDRLRGSVLDDKTVITDEVRERIRKELAEKSGDSE